jgi:hypothetical protein
VGGIGDVDDLEAGALGGQVGEGPDHLNVVDSADIRDLSEEGRVGGVRGVEDDQAGAGGEVGATGSDPDRLAVAPVVSRQDPTRAVLTRV